MKGSRYLIRNKTKSGRKSFIKNILTLLTGTTIAQAIPIAVSPILTRMYTPEDFGLLALYLSITSIISVAITARYELAIMLPEEDDEAKNLLALSIIIAACISLVLFLIILVFGRAISDLLGNRQIYQWLYFIPISLFLMGIYQAFNYWSSRKQEYQRLATNRVAQTITTAGANVGIGSIKDGAMGLILGNFIAQFIASIRLSIKSIRRDKISISDISIKKMQYVAKRFDQFPKVSVWSAMLNTASVQMPIFIMSVFFSSTIVGWYSLSNRVLNMPISVLGNTVAQVFFQTSSNLKHTDEVKLGELTYKSYKNLLWIGLIPISVLFAFGDVIFSFVFGQEWVIAGEYARLLSVWLLLVFISSPLSLLFTVMEKEDKAFLFNIGIFISRIISLLVGAVIFKDAFITVLLFAVSGVVFWLWHCVYILKMVKISYKISLIYTISTISTVLGISLVIRYLLLNNIW